MRKRYEINVVELNCPFCINHRMPDWIFNSQSPIGQKIVMRDVHTNSPPARASGRFFGQDMTPYAIVLEEEVFMGRTRWKSILFSVGSYDEYTTYQFKREFMKIPEL